MPTLHKDRDCHALQARNDIAKEYWFQFAIYNPKSAIFLNDSPVHDDGLASDVV